MIKDYYDFVDEFIKLQAERTTGDSVAIMLHRKQLVLKRYGYSANDYLWELRLEVLQEILTECKRSKNVLQHNTTKR